MQAFEHHLPRGYEKAALHQVIRAAKLKQLLMFLTWLAYYRRCKLLNTVY
ncbi:hypothetical protein HMPREF1367_02797 [Enterococcus faecium ERV38]|nr:hypothetical protein HMPREF1367_02797 [Enterococcus faecium ERV38]